MIRTVTSSFYAQNVGCEQRFLLNWQTFNPKAGLLVYWFTGLHVYRFTCLQVYRFTGLQVYRFKN